MAESASVYPVTFNVIVSRDGKEKIVQLVRMHWGYLDLQYQ